MSRKMELAAPPGTDDAEESVEVLRAWIVDGSLHVSLLPTAFETPEVWGLLLADVARHVGDAVTQEGLGDGDEVVAAIREYFNAELEAPTDETEGEFVEPS